MTVALTALYDQTITCFQWNTQKRCGTKFSLPVLGWIVTYANGVNRVAPVTPRGVIEEIDRGCVTLKTNSVHDSFVVIGSDGPVAAMSETEINAWLKRRYDQGGRSGTAC